MLADFGSRTTAEEAASVFAAEIKGKNVLITGPSLGGLGAETARVISKFGAGIVILAGRSRDKLEETEKAIKSDVPTAKTRLLILDLNSLAAIGAAADEVLAYPEPIHVLINNAAIMAIDYAITADGYEAQFGVNYLAHFLFTARIFPKLRESGSPRVVNISSGGHRYSPFRFDDPGFSGGEKYDRWAAYAQSKTANILFSVELARRGVFAFSVHPGSVPTNLPKSAPLKEMVKIGIYNEKGEPVYSGHTVWKTLAEGASSYIVASFDPSMEPGSYIVDSQVHNERAQPYALDPEDAKRLWKLSEELVGEAFNI
ncbi:hypothetical protein BOTBODRAFT_27801 [Botryobasidium botryosum FD-172 SS1]|uniref:Uncharacterized protein n=1 Tax=Botryobasidium botryosum (strain FD-172 SS1) TaxID=930990 RepID=A0A067MWZ7_BOTB1|nr:hypothetical protein BOTBODRAFT_27801 [Botryobasidium botryosum FD-172 SS1]